MIYFIRESSGEHVKIGYTHKNVVSRLSDLQVGNPRDLIIEAVHPGGRKIERLLHKAFKPYAIRGEWFVYADIIRAYASQARTIPYIDTKGVSSSDLIEYMYNWMAL
uniref:Bacteriophage T5 Orf172 DNA-binding domain-containing protein n=1 Tax=viral metagenome TaxID=1070528 RepID=A0A6M3IZN0_9ZZZZ